MKGKVAILSDIHIGDNSPTCWYQTRVHEPYLMSILKWIANNASDISELVLLGDVVDMWTYPFNIQPPSFKTIAAKNPNIFGLNGGLAMVLDALDGAVTYVTGNHDMAVTEADVSKITSPGGHRLRFSNTIYNPGKNSSVVLAHGNNFTMFNAPDTTTKWSPLPVGHFVTRTVATYWQSHLTPGQTVADLKDQGAPNGIDWTPIIEKALLNPLQVSVAGALIDGVAYEEDVSESKQIILADGSTTTLDEVKKVYENLFSYWVAVNGGGDPGVLIAGKAALADYNASYMGWFAQRQAFQSNGQLVVMGHTHFPISGLTGSLVNYINSGFECPSIPDIPARAISFAVVDTNSMTNQILKIVHEADDTFSIIPCPAPTTSIVISPFMDYSCYVIIDNSQNTKNLNFESAKIGNGYFVNPPKSINAGSSATIWLQDYPNLVPPHGSDATLVYRTDDNEKFVFNFDCPTGFDSNSCSGGSSFQAKSGDGPWLPPGRVPEKGHPLFVHFKVMTGIVEGAFSGNCGENSSAVSVAGLQPSESVVLNGKSDLSGCMVANNNGAVFGIRLDKVSGIYEYQLSVDAQGPEGIFSGSMYLYFTDQSGDRYLLTIFDHTRKTHTLQYNSSAPAIMKIEWNNDKIH